MENNLEKRTELKIELDIEKLQERLVPLVKEMFLNGEICFNSDFYIPSKDGNHWLLKDNLEGNFIVDFYEEDSEWYTNLSKKISEDYQKVIRKYFKVYGKKVDDCFKEGNDDLFEALNKWSDPMINLNLITSEEIGLLKKEFEDLISKKKNDFFSYVHGNIIGDHIFIAEDKTSYLLGMRIVSKLGKGYYDFLRSLDWIFLKSESNEKNFNFIVSQMKEKTSEFDWEEVRLVFALRCIGILGWDMVQRGDYGKGDKDEKIKYLLKFIKREY